MKVHYSLNPNVVRDDVEGPAILSLLKKAHVHTVWLWGFFHGRMWCTVEEMIEARTILEKEGFEVGVIQLAVGHPGNALNPEDDSLDLQIPDHWQYRIDRSGQKVYHCADIEEAMIEDNVKAVQVLRDAGFKRFFLDDDLRMGNWGVQIEGSFDKRSIEAFNKIYHRQEDRESLAHILTTQNESALQREWVAYNCSKVTRLMKAMDIPDVQLGLMVMHFGDERHGIDLAELDRSLKECMFRVGELQFSDDSFGSPRGKMSELLGIQHHLNLVDRERAFSETTVFPPRALTPQNLIYKAKLAVAAGIPNIYFMSGTWQMEEDYWQVIAQQMPSIERVEQQCALYERTYPVHVANGTHGSYAEAIEPSALPLLAGLPAKPVRGNEGDDTGDILLFFGDYLITEEWERHLKNYKRVLLDKKAMHKNRERINQLLTSHPHVQLWEDEPTETKSKTAALRTLLAKEKIDFPYIRAGGNICLIWLQEMNAVILFNVEEQSNQGTLHYQGQDYPVLLQPLAFALLQWREGNCTIQEW